MKGIDTDVAQNLQRYDEPDTEELDSLLSAVEKPMRFKELRILQRYIMR